MIALRVLMARKLLWVTPSPDLLELPLPRLPHLEAPLLENPYYMRGSLLAPRNRVGLHDSKQVP